MLSLLLAAALQVAGPMAPPQVDPVFAEWTIETPGCSVGLGIDGEPVIRKGFGMADLERRVPNTGDTIFEAGSVSKQFTAAAVLLLARDGKLSLEDPVRRYIPELPEYESPVTIRQMLTHTSGLRDWGSVASIGGWPRTSRVYTHGHVLDILARQRSLNFPPGTRWSYSNSGYNLAAILVARVSGMSFADFTRQRIFEPLGMASTSWRDDHTRIVPRRALAYEKQSDGYHTDLPFENVHGNGGLLTTVGDLLTWNENFVTPKVGDRSFVTEQTTPGRFADGQAHDYGLGVWVGQYRGVREVRHSGSTAGYRAHLTRFPDQHTSIAVLCNAANADAGALTYKVADIVLGRSLAPETTPRPTHELSAADVTGLVGLYRNTVTGVAARIIPQEAGLRVERGPALIAQSGSVFVTAAGLTTTFDGRGGARVVDAFGRVDTLERVAVALPDASALREFEGEFASAEAEVVATIAAEGDSLILRRRPDSVVRLTPLYQDAFVGTMGTIMFRRGADGRVTSFSVSQERVWDLRFERRSAPPTQ